MADTTVHLEVDRNDYSRTRIVEQPLPRLGKGQVRFRIERFAVTANNVTYAVIGDLLGYWSFFPTETGWGRVPAMGWGEIVASAHPDVAAGGRYFGWFPMSRSIDVTVSPSAEGVRDDGEHRAPHAAVYRSYTSTERDGFYQSGADAEDRHALLRGLFLTAFLADDFFGEHKYYGASRVIVLSASSKTAIGFAQRAATRGLTEVIGVTSARNVDFVKGLGWYDRVVVYDEVDRIPADAPAVSVDMAGDGGVLGRLHAHMGDQLRYSMIIGLSHHDAPRAAPPARGPTPEMFFAPTQVSKRLQDWGSEGYRERVGEALRGFVDASRNWLEVKRSSGPDGATAAWRAALHGQVPPNIGQIVSLW
jgi:NADPH:quinone reductase-like Zn-dependent oxidoreductase